MNPGEKPVGLPRQGAGSQTLRGRCLAAGLALATFLLVMASPIRKSAFYTSSDALGSMMAAQSLIQDRTHRLEGQLDPAVLQKEFGYRVITLRGGMYYRFPIGTPVLSAPVVWLANRAGMDMRVMEDQHKVQSLLAALSLAAAVVLVFFLMRAVVPPGSAAALAAGLVLGSSFMSSGGNALWSQNFATVFLLFSIGLLLGSFCRQVRGWRRGLALAASMMLAYLCRPTSLLFCLLALLYLLISDRRLMLFTTFFFLAAMAVFALWSWSAFGQSLPPYYSNSSIAHGRDFSVALAGNLVSPSRGIFIFSPLLLPILVAGLRSWRHRPVAFGLFFSWFFLHILAVSRFGHWWGGYSYGPRLTWESVCAAVAIAALAVPCLSGRAKRLFWLTFLPLAALSVFIHTWQAHFNSSTTKWSYSPSVDQYPEYVFDWNCPQFLATESRLAARNEGHKARASRQEPTREQPSPIQRNIP